MDGCWDTAPVIGRAGRHVVASLEFMRSSGRAGTIAISSDFDWRWFRWAQARISDDVTPSPHIRILCFGSLHHTQNRLMIRAHTHSQGKRGLSGLDNTYFLDNWLVVWFRTTDWEECRFGLGLDFALF